MSLLNDILEHQELGATQLTAYIDEYESIQPYDCMIDTARAVVALSAQDHGSAEKWILSAIRKNPANHLNHLYYALIARALGQYAIAAEECDICLNFAAQFEIKPDMEPLLRQVNEILNEVGPKLSPEELQYFFIQRNILSSNGANFPQYRIYGKDSWTIYQGAFLYFDKKKRYNDYIGMWPQGHLDSYSYIVQQGLICSNQPNAYSVTPVQSWKALQTKRFEFSGAQCVLAVAATNASQTITVTDGEKRIVSCLMEAPNIFHYFNMDRAAVLTSDQAFIVSKPISTQRKKGKKRLILSLFMDGLSQRYLEKTNYQDMPNLKRFFEKGTIFNRCYATSEWTQPSVPSMATGLYTTHHHIIYYSSAYRYPPHVKTVSEIFNDDGYFTVRISGSKGTSPYLGGLRGYDSSIHKSMTGFPDSHLIEDALDYMEAFPNTPKFISLELFDAHRSLDEHMDKTWKYDVNFNIALQANLDYQTSLTKTKGQEKSVRMRHSEILVKRYQTGLHQVDRRFKSLFDYILANYEEDEFLVCLYSDHGMSPLDQEEYLLKNMRTNSVLMFRGSGVPAGISEEYVNHIDYLPILTKLAGINADLSRHDCVLPRTFGGPGRDYVYTESIYQGQTYKAAVRTDKFECRFEANANTDIDGLIDLSQGYTLRIFSVQTGEEIHDAELAEDFEGIVLDHIKESIKY